MSDFVPWGDDAHRALVEFLPWPDNARLACGNMALRNAMAKAKKLPLSWEQAQSSSYGAEKMAESFIKAAKILTPSARPNFSMLMVHRGNTAGDLCSRLHSANLVPIECPIFVVKSFEGVYGAGVRGEEVHYSAYADPDVELDEQPRATAVLTVAYIPPEETSDGPVSRVGCFLVDNQTQCYRYDSRPWADGVTLVSTERAPSGSPGAVARGAIAEGASAGGGATSSSRGDAEPAGGTTPRASSANDGGNDSGGIHESRPSSVVTSGESSAAPSGKGDSPTAREESGKQVSSQASVTADSKARSSRRPRPELSGPSTNVPLENADTIFLMGTDEDMLTSTTEWLNRALPEAVMLGGISDCSLFVGDQEFPADDRAKWPATRELRVVGIALKGVHAIALSAAGFEGTGPVFRVDETIDNIFRRQAQPGEMLHNVSVVWEGGSPCSRVTTADAIWEDLTPQPVQYDQEYEPYDPPFFLAVGSCAEELLRGRPFSTLGDDPEHEGGGEAMGETPMAISVRIEDIMGFDRNVGPGQFARFMGSTPELCLADTEAIYRNCRQRMKRIGGVVLSSIHFTCAYRQENVAILNKAQELAGVGLERGKLVGSLYRQEMVRFCKTFNAPAVGVLCSGEVGPLPAMYPGILPKTAPSALQSFRSCTAVLVWSPELSQSD